MIGTLQIISITFVLGLCIAGSLAVPAPLRTDSTLNGRIIGGEVAPEGAHPYIVSVQYEERHMCVASIVSKNYVITTALCAKRQLFNQGSFANSVTIKAGINKLSDRGNVYKVLKITIHEDYDSWFQFNDVAILQVEDIDLNLPKISTIRVETEFVEGGEPVTLSGWGSTWLEGPTPDDLRQMHVATISGKDCKAAYGDRVKDTNICTLSKTGDGVLFRDYGSPLVRRVDDHEILVGIASWGRSSSSGNPDVFGRISAFVPWFNRKCNNCLN